MKLIDVIATLPHSRKPKQRLTTAIKRIVIHHTAGNEKSPSVIARAHMAKGEQGCPYHYVIMPNGWVYKCQAVTSITPHARGGNSDGIGVALVGNFMKQPPPTAQLEALRDLIGALWAEYPSLAVVAHRDVKPSKTACPGDAFPLTYPPGAKYPAWDWSRYAPV